MRQTLWILCSGVVVAWEIVVAVMVFDRQVLLQKLEGLGSYQTSHSSEWMQKSFVYKLFLDTLRMVRRDETRRGAFSRAARHALFHGQDAVVWDQRMEERMAERDAAAAKALAERDVALAAKLGERGFLNRWTPRLETSPRLWMGSWTILNNGFKNRGKRFKTNGQKRLCIPMIRKPLSPRRNFAENIEERWKTRMEKRRQDHHECF